MRKVTSSAADAFKVVDAQDDGGIGKLNIKTLRNNGKMVIMKVVGIDGAIVGRTYARWLFIRLHPRRWRAVITGSLNVIAVLNSPAACSSEILRR